MARAEQPRGTAVYRWTKTAVDLILGTVLAILALPVVALAALGSLLVFRARPILLQERVGLRGRTFRCPKIRSLPAAAPRAADKYEIAVLPVPAWGRFLRAYHIDELPQLLLVPLRRMSLVGPRPEMLAMMDRYPEELRTVREQVRPGCTGLWQISQDSATMIYEHPEYDVCYVEHCSTGLDLWILARTVAQFCGASPIEHSRVFGEGRPCRQARSGGR